MEFILKEYHRNINNDKLIEDVIKTANKLKKTSITCEEYDKYGKYHSSTIRRKIGSWKTILEKANLSIKSHNFKCDYTINDIKNDIGRVLKIINEDTLTKKQYNQYGKYNGNTLEKKFNGWNNVLKECGLDVKFIHSITKKELFTEIERIWILLGRQPTTNDIKKGISKYSLNSYTRKFGGWRQALTYFISYINDEKDEDINNTKLKKIDEDKDNKEKENKLYTHKTSRDINLRLRFKVMARDNFKCCICGASPATNPNIILHIDHIKPWAKGGETVLENLQTLCSNCNLGKSDLDM